MTGQKKHGGWGEKNTWFEKGCVSLAFFLSAVLILLFGIRIAGNTIQVAQAEKIEIINNLVEGLSESSKIKSQSKRFRVSFINIWKPISARLQDLSLFPATILPS